MYRALVAGLLVGARAAFLACIGGLAFLMRVCLRWFPALVPDCFCIPHHRVLNIQIYRILVCAWFVTFSNTFSQPNTMPIIKLLVISAGISSCFQKGRICCPHGNARYCLWCTGTCPVLPMTVEIMFSKTFSEQKRACGLSDGNLVHPILSHWHPSYLILHALRCGRVVLCLYTCYRCQGPVRLFSCAHVAQACTTGFSEDDTWDRTRARAVPLLHTASTAHAE